MFLEKGLYGCKIRLPPIDIFLSAALFYKSRVKSDGLHLYYTTDLKQAREHVPREQCLVVLDIVLNELLSQLSNTVFKTLKVFSMRQFQTRDLRVCV